MDIDAIRDEIKLKLTGGILELEIDDTSLDKIINSALREIQRYIDSTVFITVPFQSCIDLSKYNVNAVTNVFRSEGYMGSNMHDESAVVDPMQASMWQMTSIGNGMYNFNNYTLDYGAWNAMLQVRNTTSTDLANFFDRSTGKLYINTIDRPSQITIEFVPRYNNVSDIKSDFWIDVLIKLATALTKQIVGRIRTRFTQSNALWLMDGQTMLDEGNNELNALREKLIANSNLVYPID